jgi:large subunit ribosomal protein L4
MADTTTETFRANAFSARGTARDSIALPAELFDGTVNMPVMHQAVKAYLANQRQGNAATKIRKYVVGGNQKPWKQKGTGRARQGSTRAPHWVGGGTVFGPIPRSYAQYVPRQVRALARKSALNARARENAIFIIDRFEYDSPKTSRLKALIDKLGLGEQKVLVLTNGSKQNVFLSGRNLPTVHVMPYGDVSTYHLLWSDSVLIESDAIGYPLTPLAERDDADAKHSAPSRATKAKSPAKKAAKAAGAPKAKAAATKAPAKAKAKKSASGARTKPRTSKKKGK